MSEKSNKISISHKVIHIVPGLLHVDEKIINKEITKYILPYYIQGESLPLTHRESLSIITTL